MEYLEQALQRLEKEDKTVTDRYGRAMKDAVRRALESFARQDEEFAQAIAQGGCFADCMKRVSGGVKEGAISDLDAYRRAVEFYFPGAVIRATMEMPQPGAGADRAAGASARQGAGPVGFPVRRPWTRRSGRSSWPGWLRS